MYIINRGWNSLCCSLPKRQIQFFCIFAHRLEQNWSRTKIIIKKLLRFKYFYTLQKHNPSSIFLLTLLGEQCLLCNTGFPLSLFIYIHPSITVGSKVKLGESVTGWPTLILTFPQLFCTWRIITWWNPPWSCAVHFSLSVCKPWFTGLPLWGEVVVWFSVWIPQKENKWDVSVLYTHKRTY